jgi:hypothetical protein
MRRPGRPRVRPSTVALVASMLVSAGLLLWGADLLARWGAESLIARHAQAATGVLERPSVDIHGRFFLPQVLSGRYEEVEVTVDDLVSGPLRIERLDAELRGVRLTFHDLLLQKNVPIYVESSRERATLTYEHVNHYLDVTGRQVRIDAAPQGRARLTGTVEVFGREVSASAIAVLEAADGELLVRPSELDTDTDLDAASRLLLRQRFSFVVPMDPLPYGQQLTGIVPSDAGIVVEAEGTDIVANP